MEPPPARSNDLRRREATDGMRSDGIRTSFTSTTLARTRPNPAAMPAVTASPRKRAPQRTPKIGKR
jgi:hypothetical protein